MNATAFSNNKDGRACYNDFRSLAKKIIYKPGQETW